MEFYLGILYLFLLLLFYKISYEVIAKIRKRYYNINTDSKVLITGACMGIGRQTALLFAKNHKCTIIIYDINENLSQNIIREINEVGGKAAFYRCDVSKPEEVKEVVQETYTKFGNIDILINNAGIVTGKKVLETNTEDIVRVMNVNYMGPVNMLKEIVPRMIKIKNGHIVTIASVASMSFLNGAAEYCASKAAIFSFHNCFRLELKAEKRNISSTIICPYQINTGMFKGFSNPTFFRTLDENHVGNTIYNAILEKRELVFIPSYIGILLYTLLWLPIKLLDKVALLIGKDSMKNFVGRVKKD